MGAMGAHKVRSVGKKSDGGKEKFIVNAGAGSLPGQVYFYCIEERVPIF